MKSNELEAKILAQAPTVVGVNLEAIERATTTRTKATDAAESKPKRKSKHGNTKTDVDGMAFDSKWEARRWKMLLRKLRAGLIDGLQRQVPFELHAAGGVCVCRYRADFVYVEAGRRVVEDAKGMRTAMYKLKARWMEAEHGIVIRETFEKDPGTW